MPTPLEIGGTRWTREGAEPTKAYWTEINAYREAIYNYLSRNPKKLPDSRTMQAELLPLVAGLTNAVLRQQEAIHQWELIGIEAKKDRLSNGE